MKDLPSSLHCPAIVVATEKMESYRLPHPSATGARRQKEVTVGVSPSPEERRSKLAGVSLPLSLFSLWRLRKDEEAEYANRYLSLF
nr:hypothetical protein Itr_chr02CG11550 [Ipomoea trifida]GLL19667.1 hypothetical protein Itr_chr02CG11560 [Ipomoea trifida]